jgi:DNA mismatch repair protein MutS
MRPSPVLPLQPLGPQEQDRPSTAPPFESILFLDSRDRSRAEAAGEPSFFRDLNLDQVLAALSAGREEYELAPFFYAPLHDPEAVRYRQEVARDLEDERLLAAVVSFAAAMRAMREQLARAEKLYYPLQKQRWLLQAASTYRAAVVGLAEALGRLEPTSRGFAALRDYLAWYTRCEQFLDLARDVDAVEAALAEVRYCLQIKGGRVRVTRYQGEADYSAEVLATFAKFERKGTRDYRLEFPDWPDMNHVEARILDCVARLYPEAFALLGAFARRHRDYLDARVAAFDREVQLYLAYRDLAAPLKAAGLSFCYPRICPRSEGAHVRAGFDLALALRLVAEGKSVVRNDLRLAGEERVLVVTGPNQGGKTTFARMVGQLHYLAALGLPVPGEEATLFLPDRIFTHFEREEALANLRGKLEDELVRIRATLEQASERSLVIMNESFSATTLSDALFLGRRVLERVIELGAACVCVTFVDELAFLGPATVSLVAEVDPSDPTVRTYRVVRRPADGLAYAAALAEKYGLTYAALRRRLSP